MYIISYVLKLCEYCVHVLFMCAYVYVSVCMGGAVRGALVRSEFTVLLPVERNSVLVSLFLQRDCGGAFLTAAAGTVCCWGGEDPAGSGSTPPEVQLLQGGEHSVNSAFRRTHHPLQSPPVLRGAVAEPASDASWMLSTAPAQKV